MHFILTPFFSSQTIFIDSEQTFTTTEPYKNLY